MNTCRWPLSNNSILILVFFIDIVYFLCCCPCWRNKLHNKYAKNCCKRTIHSSTYRRRRSHMFFWNTSVYFANVRLGMMIIKSPISPYICCTLCNRRAAYRITQDTVDAISLNCLKSRLNKMTSTKIGFLWTSLLNRRPCHMG